MTEELLEAKVNYLIAKTNLLVGLTAIAISAAVGTKPYKISRDYDEFVKQNKKLDDSFNATIAEIYTKE